MKNRGRPACTVAAPYSFTVAAADFFALTPPLFFYIEIALEIADIFLEGNDTLGRDLANGLRIIVFKGFDDIDITCLLELVDLDAQVTSRGIGLFPEVSELRLLYRDQDGHYGQA